MFGENTTVDNNVVNFSLNVTKFGIGIGIVEVDKSYDFGFYGGNYQFLSYQNVRIYKMTWCSINTIARVLNHISLERACHHYVDKVCGFV